MLRVACLQSVHLSGQALLKLLRTFGGLNKPLVAMRGLADLPWASSAQALGKYMLNMDCCQRFLLDMGSSEVDYHGSAVVHENWAISNCFINNTLEFTL